MDGRNREEIKIGQEVYIVEKQNQRSGTLTKVLVARILTKSNYHPHGIKIISIDGIVGRVQGK